MKVRALLVTATVFASLTVHAARQPEKEILVCKGIEGSRGVSLRLEAKSNSDVEGKAIAYYATIINKAHEKTSGIIFGYKEDVMLKLVPKRGDSVQVSGTIFMDDEEQNLEIDNGNDKIDLKFNCDRE